MSKIERNHWWGWQRSGWVTRWKRQQRLPQQLNIKVLLTCPSCGGRVEELIATLTKTGLYAPMCRGCKDSTEATQDTGSTPVIST